LPTSEHHPAAAAPGEAPLNRSRAQLSLLLASVIWGSAFAVQRIAAQNAGVFLFNGARFLLGALVILPLVRPAQRPDRKQWLLTALAGLILFSASGLQQAGLKYTTAANAGFITSLYVVFVPLILVLFLRRRLALNAWLAALLAVAGGLLLSTGGDLGALSFRGGASVLGDLLELAGAAVWALHVLTVDRTVQHMDLLTFAAGQFVVAALLNFGAGLWLEQDRLPALLASGWGVFYTGVFSVGVAYTLQAYGQKYSTPSSAAVILSMEAVFAGLFGYLILRESLNAAQLVGCLIILLAVLLAQKRCSRV